MIWDDLEDGNPFCDHRDLAHGGHHPECALNRGKPECDMDCTEGEGDGERLPLNFDRSGYYR